MENLLNFKLGLVFFCITLLLARCSNKNLNDSYFDTKKYEQELKLFPPFLVDFFPDSVSNVYSIEKNIDTTNQCIYYMNFDFDFTSPKKKAFMSKYMNDKIRNFAANDSTMIIIKRSNIRDRSEDIQSITNKSIVPYFESSNLSYIGVDNLEIYSDTTRSGLSDNFKIYVLDSKSGNYWDGLKPLDYMPEGWKNGYSKGICINDRKGVIIYWIVIW